MLLFIDTFVMDIMDFKVIYCSFNHSVFIHSDFVWFDLTEV